MDIESYLISTLSVYPLCRIKIRAEIELQRLVDDKILYVGDAYYLRGKDGSRIGVVCEFKDSGLLSEVRKVEVVCQRE